ncbi:MAG: hypothetical protein ACK8QZ_11035, partial [Anaerolineales bacterium]
CCERSLLLMFLTLAAVWQHALTWDYHSFARLLKSPVRKVRNLDKTAFVVYDAPLQDASTSEVQGKK